MGGGRSNLSSSFLREDWKSVRPCDRTPVKVQVLRKMLIESNYDMSLTNYLCNGFSFGFKLGLDQPVSYVAQAIADNAIQFRGNHKSALSNPKAMELKLTKELQAGRLLGPFLEPVLQHTIVSPLGLVKKKELGKFRVIHDLSFPRQGASVNSFIPQDEASVSYDSVDTAIRLIRQVGKGAILCKTDIEHAYKLINIAESDIPALAMRWFQHWLYDATLPMGSRSGCAIFERLSKAIQHIAEHKGCGPMCHILDDFLLVTQDTYDADIKLPTFLDMCVEVGIPIVAAKTERGTCLIFMGIEMDTVAMEARLPEEKLVRCRALLKKFQQKKSITARQLQSLLGLLNFACTVVVPGRAFLRRMFQLLWGMKRWVPYFRLRLSRGAKHDMRTWETFLSNYNGISVFLPNEAIPEQQLGLQWAVSAVGFATILGGAWVAGTWSLPWSKERPLLQQLVAVLVLVTSLGTPLEGSRIQLYSSVKEVVTVVNSQSDRDPRVMVLVRALVLALLKANIQLHMSLVSFVDNHDAFLMSSTQGLQQQENRSSMDNEPCPVAKVVTRAISRVESMNM